MVRCRRSARVLVVDDDDALRRLIVRVLGRAGFDMQSAGSVAEALACSIDWRPHVAIVDLELCGENGLDLVDAMRDELGRAAPQVLVCSGATQPAIRDEPLLAKPFALAELIDRVRALAEHAVS